MGILDIIIFSFAKKDVPKTTFCCPEALGTYEWVVMPFGLKNDGVTYQREMNSIFHDFIETFMNIYIYDIVVKSVSGKSHRSSPTIIQENEETWSEDESSQVCILCAGRGFFRLCGP